MEACGGDGDWISRLRLRNRRRSWWRRHFCPYAYFDYWVRHQICCCHFQMYCDYSIQPKTTPNTYISKLKKKFQMGCVYFVAGMIMGASSSSVWYNLRVAHPTKDVPIIDHDLALLFQPMLMLGITVGVSLSVVFPYWLITVLIIILFIGLPFSPPLRSFSNSPNSAQF